MLSAWTLSLLVFGLTLTASALSATASTAGERSVEVTADSVVVEHRVHQDAGHHSRHNHSRHSSSLVELSSSGEAKREGSSLVRQEVRSRETEQSHQLERGNPGDGYTCMHLCNRQHAAAHYLNGQSDYEVERVKHEREAGTCDPFWDGQYALPPDTYDKNCGDNARCLGANDDMEPYGLCICTSFDGDCTGRRRRHVNLGYVGAAPTPEPPTEPLLLEQSETVDENQASRMSLVLRPLVFACGLLSCFWLL